MMRLVPRSLLGQLAGLILGAFLAAQVISAWWFADERGAAIRAAQRLETIERASAVAELLRTAPQASRESILAAANSRLVRFSIAETPLVAADGSGTQATDSLRTEEVAVLPHRGEMRSPPAPLARMHERMRNAGMAPVEFRISVLLYDGDWLNVAARFHRPDMQAPPAILGAMVLSLALILAALWLGLRRITTPLRQLALVADRMDLDGMPAEMPTGGPREVRALSDAFARMQARLAGMIADRTRMLAALGHDLRSPITALRLRADMVEDDETRERMTAILDEMQDMVETTLAFARGISTDQPTEEVDLADLIRDLAQELSETGPPITVKAAVPVVAQLRRGPMRRAIRNILENAQRYGNGAEVRLGQAGAAAEILIDDHGPGIPAPDLDRVFDPFVRLETSRSRETGGIGLGLPIAREILRAHGGDIVLTARPEAGLRARITLPMNQH
ncbi:MAG: ATP-binding protein [Paracoccus sp. (in: a-proteobacteria)]|nr:ATP-binding protein [Paracoccus sp. (in: a-proteobacteria)]